MNTHVINLVPGSSQAVSITDHANFKPTATLTILAWVRYTATNTYDYTIFQSGDIDNTASYFGGIYLRGAGGTAGKMQFALTKDHASGVGDAYLDANTAINDGKWHFVAAVWDGTNMKIYIDGVLDNSGAGTTPVYPSPNYVRIGCRTKSDGTNQTFFDGQLDEVAFFNTALTQTEIIEYMWRRLSGSETGLVEGWSLDNTYNGIKGSHNGAAVGTPTFRTTPPWFEDLGDDAATQQLANISTLLNDASLIGHYRLQGDGFDSTFNKRDGTLTNSPTAVTGKFGDTNGALDFELSSSQYVTIASNAAHAPSSYSISAWIKLETTTGFQVVLAKDGGGSLQMFAFGHSAGRLYIEHYSNAAALYTYLQDNSNQMTTGVWYHVVVTNNAGTFKFYRDGVEITASTGSGTYGAMGDKNTPLTIAKRTAAADPAYFDGVIDDVAFFSRVLTPYEIETLHADSPTGLNVRSLRMKVGETQVIKFPGGSAALKPTAAVTVAAWIRSSVLGANKNIFQCYSENTNPAGYYLRVDSGNHVEGQVGKNTGTNVPADYQAGISTTNVIDGTWHHCAMVFNGSTIKIYVDGVQEDSDTSPSAIGYAATTYIQIGARNNSGSDSNYFEGEMAQLCVFSRALTVGEIGDLMDAIPDTGDSTLELYMDYQGGLLDKSSNAFAPNSVLNFPRYTLDVPFEQAAGTVPVLDTDAVDDITSNSATGNGEVISADGTVTERGFCWSTSSNPTTADPKVTAAGTIGVYDGAITGLLPNTLYHVRAYAINEFGTGYGDDVTFTTLDAVIRGVATLSGSPVEDAKITLILSSTNDVDVQMTNASGEYEFTGLDVTELYHVAAEYDDGVDLYNAESLPFMTPIEE